MQIKFPSSFAVSLVLLVALIFVRVYKMSKAVTALGTKGSILGLTGGAAMNFSQFGSIAPDVAGSLAQSKPDVQLGEQQQQLQQQQKGEMNSSTFIEHPPIVDPNGIWTVYKREAVGEYKYRVRERPEDRGVKGDDGQGAKGGGPQQPANSSSGAAAEGPAGNSGGAGGGEGQGQGRGVGVGKELPVASSSVGEAKGNQGAVRGEGGGTGKSVDGEAQNIVKGGGGNFSRLFRTKGGGAGALRGCYHSMGAVERRLFANLSWKDAEEEIAQGGVSKGECGDALMVFSRCGGDKAWEVEMVNAGRGQFNSSGKAKVTVFTNNGTESKLTREVDHPMVSWLGDLSASKGKKTWQIGVMGDSTMRGLTKAFGELFLGPNLTLLGGLARLFDQIKIDVEGEGFALTVLFQKNWKVTYAEEARKMLGPLPRMDLFVWNVGQHAMWSPTAKAKAMRRPSVLIAGGFFGREAAKLETLLPPWTRVVYVNTNSLCPNLASDAAYKLQTESPAEASQGYLFTREGAKQISVRQRDDLEKNLKRPFRVIDSWSLTDGRCQFTTDGNHFLPLDKFKILSILQDLAF